MSIHLCLKPLKRDGRFWRYCNMKAHHGGECRYIVNRQRSRE